MTRSISHDRTRETLEALAGAFLEAREGMGRFALRARSQRILARKLAEHLRIFARQADPDALEIIADVLEGLDR